MLNTNVFVTNLYKYTCGILNGEWLSLPMDEKKLQNKINTILGNNEEYAIHDFENAPFEISEYDNVFELNTIIEELNNYDSEIIEAVNEVTNDIEQTKNIIINNNFYYVKDVRTSEELALKVDTHLLPFDYESIVNAGANLYLDWEQIGDAMICNENWYIASNNIAVLIG